MSQYYERKSSSRAAGIIILAAIAAVIAILFAALTYYGTAPEEEGIRNGEDLLAHIEATPVDDSVTTLCDALLTWELPGYYGNLLAAVEDCYVKYYYKDLPPASELATEAAKIFAINYYDDCDKDDIDEVTYALIDSYIAAIGDPYSYFRTAEEFEDYSTDLSGVFAGIGVYVEMNIDNGLIRVIRTIPGSPAEEAGIKGGDLIIGVDGFSVAEIGYQTALDLVKGVVGTSVTVTVSRGNETIDFTMQRATVVEQSVTYELTEDKIALITITSFKGNTAGQFAAAIDAAESDGAVGIIFDLRSNPGGYVFAICDSLSYLVPSGTPIASFSSDRVSEYAVHGTEIEPEDHVLSLPCVVICNEYTASAGELFTAAMRDYNEMGLIDCTLVGHTTYKKGIMQSSLTFSTGATLTLTTAYYNPPLGVNYDGIGVVPHVVLAPDAEEGLYLTTAQNELNKLLADNED